MNTKFNLNQEVWFEYAGLYLCGWVEEINIKNQCGYKLIKYFVVSDLAPYLWIEEKDLYSSREELLYGCEIKWVDAKIRLPQKSGEYLIAVKNKNKEDGIWLFDISYWNGDEFERSRTWEDILYWTEIPNPKR